MLIVFYYLFNSFFNAHKKEKKRNPPKAQNQLHYEEKPMQSSDLFVGL